MQTIDTDVHGDMKSKDWLELRDKTVILLVDDERLIRLAVGAKLKRAGYMPVEAASVDEAVSILKEHGGIFSAIISDIVMGDMDGFVFRDIVRGFNPKMPIFFMTALDPEEGSGFLKRILSDPLSYYLPKSAGTEVLLKRVQQIVASSHVERFIERQIKESKQSLTLAAHIQSSMLPPRSHHDKNIFYSAWWEPKEIVSGDVYEAMPFGSDRWLYIVGDIQGHGTSAALAMTAVQSFLKHLGRDADEPSMGPAAIANLLQGFFRANLTDVSYMTALICVHNFVKSEVAWISCGAPDLVVLDEHCERTFSVDPSRCGGLPIGLMPDTVYTDEDVVVDHLGPSAVCGAATDGLFDMSRDEDGHDKVSMDTLARIRNELTRESRRNGSIIVDPYKYMRVCREYGYVYAQDDLTILIFGPHLELDGVFEATVPLSPSSVDDQAQAMGDWCRRRGWPEEDVGRVQLVLEESLMNVYEHGFDDRERLREIANVRLVKRRDTHAELTIWESGKLVPSMAVAAGSSMTEFELINRDMRDSGRGRLIVRELCDGIERNRYEGLNETIYHVRLGCAEEGNQQ